MTGLRARNPEPAARCFAAAAVILSGLLLAGTGCAPKPAPPPASPEPAAPTLVTDPAARVQLLRARADQLGEQVRQLPGRTQEDDTRRVAAAFETLGEVLVNLGGPDPDGAYRQQLAAVQGARAGLATIGPDASPDALTDAGLRAAVGALSTVEARLFPGDAEMTKRRESVAARVPDLDRYRGPLHRTAVASVLTATDQLVQKMTAGLEERAAFSAEPTTVPATEPAGAGEAPATAPATESPATTPVP